MVRVRVRVWVLHPDQMLFGSIFVSRSSLVPVPVLVAAAVLHGLYFLYYSSAAYLFSVPVLGRELVLVHPQVSVPVVFLSA